jgi:hypothetical protein
MKVSTHFKTPSAIEKMGVDEWAELLKTLQTFSKRMENNSIKKGRESRIIRGLTLPDKSIKALVEEGRNEESLYSPGENNIYGSPYEETPTSTELYDRYNQVRDLFLFMTRNSIYIKK